MTSMTWSNAQIIIANVFQAATDMGLSVSCSVVNAKGYEIGTARMDNASWFTAGVARTKAQTAAVLGRDTHVLANLFEQYPDLRTQIGEQLPFTLTVLAGGVVTPDGDAVGVSGALPDQDMQLAQDAVARALAG